MKYIILTLFVILTLLTGNAHAKDISKYVNVNPTNHLDIDVGELEYCGGFEVSSNAEKFGGLSGIEVIEGGAKAILISDKGYFFKLDIGYDDKGCLNKVSNISSVRMKAEDGKYLKDKYRDAEAIRFSKDLKSLYVAFEGKHRVDVYDLNGLQEAPTNLIDRLSLKLSPPMPANGGVESIAVNPNGDILLIAEDKIAKDDFTNAWLFDDKAKLIKRLKYYSDNDFRPTDAVFDSDGKLYVLERYFTPLGKLSARIRLFDDFSSLLENGEIKGGRIIASLDNPYVTDNFEGIDILEKHGRKVLYLISDDNYRPWQKTYLLMFVIKN